MKPFTRTFFIAAFTSISAVAQQDTNPPPSEAQSAELQLAERPEEERIKFLLDVAAAYFRENDPESGITAYERILELEPKNIAARNLLSTAYISTKEYAKAEEMLNSLIEESPDNFQLKNNLAWLYATAENPAFRDGQKAIELAQEAMVLAPYDHHVWSTLAEAYYSAGQYERAFRTINHMVEVGRRFGKGITKEMVESYNKQVRKCKRALITENAFQDDEEENQSATLSVDEDAQ